MSDEHTTPSPSERPYRRRQSVFSGLFMMLASSYSDMVLGMVRGVLVARAIGPTGRGLMRIVHLFNKYLSNAHLGILHGVSKELPMAVGREDEADVQQIEDVGTTAVVLLESLAGLGMVMWALWAPDIQRLTRITIAIGGGIILSGQVIALYRCVLRAWGTYSVLAITAVILSVSQFLLIVFGATTYGVTGAMWGWLAAMLVPLLYLHYASGLHIRPRLRIGMLGRLIRVGLPIAGIIFANVLLRTVDGIIILRHFDAYRFGLYSIAMQIAAYLYRIPEAAGFVLMPRIWERYGARNEVAALQRHVINPTVAAAAVMPVVSGMIFILVPNAIRVILPRFTPCIFAAQVLAMAGVFLALPVAADGLLVAVNREKTVIFAKLVGALCVAGGAYWAAVTTQSLGRVAISAGIGYGVASLISLYAVLGGYYLRRLRLLRELIVCYLPLLWTLGVLKLSGLGVGWLVGDSQSIWLDMVVRMAVFLALEWPLLWYADRRTGVGKRIRQRLQRELNRPKS